LLLSCYWRLRDLCTSSNRCPGRELTRFVPMPMPMIMPVACCLCLPCRRRLASPARMLGQRLLSLMRPDEEYRTGRISHHRRASSRLAARSFRCVGPFLCSLLRNLSLRCYSSLRCTLSLLCPFPCFAPCRKLLPRRARRP